MCQQLGRRYALQSGGRTKWGVPVLLSYRTRLRGSTSIIYRCSGSPNYTDADGSSDFVPVPTSPDALYRQYRVTITPHQKKGPDEFYVKIRVKEFHDNGARLRNTYVPASF